MTNLMTASNEAQNEKSTDSKWYHIDHSASFVGEMDALLSSALLSDITFLVGGERVQAHRLILGFRSEYFRALFCSRQEEKVEAQYAISEATPSAFRTTLKYIYTGKIRLPASGVEEELGILNLADRFKLAELRQAVIDILKGKLDIDNIFSVLQASIQAPGLDGLAERCMEFACQYGAQIVAAKEFVKLPMEVVVKLLSRNSFNAEEMDIFHGITKWIEARDDIHSTRLEIVFHHFISKNCLRLHLMSQKQLLFKVRHSDLFKANPEHGRSILDALELKCSGAAGRCRASIVPDTNIARVELGASVVDGIGRNSLLSEAGGATRHRIGSEEGIVVELGQPYTINTIILKLGSRPAEGIRSYKVHVSINKHDWVLVAERTDWSCACCQWTSFDPCLVRYIRIVGFGHMTKKSEKKKNYFSLISLKALYSTKH